MGTRSDELKSDIERQRQVLGEDLEAVGDRLSPGRMVERRRSAVSQRFTSARNKVMGTADKGRGTVRDAAATAVERTGEAGQAVKDQATAAPQVVGSATEGNPLAAGLIAFGAGLLTASLLPVTEREHRAAEQLKPTLEGAAEEAKSLAEESAEHLRPKAEEAATQVREQASGAAKTVSEEASSASEQVKRDATGGVEEVQDAARRPSS
jgi:ElaB/YqjD/DUF883 family membrane-anchored ribosome-binding protein